ncbi:hypothetical protein K2173_011371 [Erythroxylum novogranatense]|uniref:Uncharacterized protein n=1 Tax=Erythroxylum novogranatense TaxID=1862640 RepID=A0AAV8S9U6_9ROSI|nr:hypothetical protein K2173_011371 [Erythroxylum novogranatense]
MSYSNPHFQSQELHSTFQARPMSKNRSFAQVICKSIFFVLFLIAIPLFPSEAPEFISETVLTKFWELVHLLFIGVAVCYGLFSRRSNSDADYETYPTIEDSQSSYVSRIFHVSSIFEDGDGSSDERNMYQAWYSQYQKGESVVVGAANGGGSVSGVHGKTSSFNSEIEFQVPFEQNQNNVTEAWNSQYCRNEPMVMLSKPSYALDECGIPLGLPVRSLKSRVRSSVHVQVSGESEFSSSSRASSSSSRRSNKEDSFGDMCAMNLEEEKLNETLVSSSQIPWRSRSGRMEMKEDVGKFHSHFRPLSVDETQFDSLRSQSFRSTTSLSSKASSASYSPTRLSPSEDSVDSNELYKSESEELDNKNGFHASDPAVSESPGRRSTMNKEPPLNAFHLRRYSSGSLFQKDVQESSKGELKTLEKDTREGSLSSKLDKQPPSLLKSPSRGKSVRTIRARKVIPESEKVMRTWKNDLEEEKLDNLSSSTKQKDLDAQFHTPKPSLVKHKMKEVDCSDTVTPQSEEDSESETSKLKEENALDCRGDDSGNDPNEVDKKAGEFIAKFREQIRLQKVASMERSRGSRIASNHFR